jgi:hypothetical protein
MLLDIFVAVADPDDIPTTTGHAQVDRVMTSLKEEGFKPVMAFCDAFSFVAEMRNPDIREAAIVKCLDLADANAGDIKRGPYSLTTPPDAIPLAAYKPAIQ